MVFTVKSQGHGQMRGCGDFMLCVVFVSPVKLGGGEEKSLPTCVEMQGQIQNLHCPPPRGTQVINEAEGFTEARSAERMRVGEGVTPPAGEFSPDFFFGEIASKWCILRLSIHVFKLI